MSVIEALAKEFTRLPGVGPKTAMRLVYHLMKRPKEEATHLAEAILEVVRRIIPCARCGNFSESEICDICSDPRREMGVLCIVEEAYEVGSIERTGRFAGRYHVLGGRLSPLDGVGPDDEFFVELSRSGGGGDSSVDLGAASMRDRVSTSSFTSRMPRLNSTMLFPTERATSGRRRPKISNATTPMIAHSMGPGIHASIPGFMTTILTQPSDRAATANRQVTIYGSAPFSTVGSNAVESVTTCSRCP